MDLNYLLRPQEDTTFEYPEDGGTDWIDEALAKGKRNCNLQECKSNFRAFLFSNRYGVQERGGQTSVFGFTGRST